MSVLWKRCCMAALICALLAGCQSTDLDSNRLEVRCQSPRPEICTFEYRPVCGLTETGQWQTQGNACSACGNAEVVGYRSGACEGGE